MSNWKMVVGMVLGSLVLVGVMVFGLMKMGGEQEGVVTSVDELVAGAGWMTGEDGYKVTVVEFADLQCPACRQAEPVARQLRQMDGVRYVYRHLPLLTIHKNAWSAAKTAETAKQMGKGWEMIELLFENQDEWSDVRNFEEKTAGYAEELELDKAEFETLYESKEVEDQVVRDNALAGKLNLGGTPTFFVDGEQVAVNFVLTKVKDIIENR